MNSRRIAAIACLLILAGTASVAAAQNPFVGTWKLDQARSHMAGNTMRFNQAEGQAIELNTGGTHYSFRVDGKDYRMASGDLAAWKQVDPNTWTTSYLKPDGKLLNTDTWRLSPDGQKLTVVNTGTNPNGTNFTNTAIYRRTAGASGLLGAWKSTSIRLSSPNELEISAYGLGGVLIKVPSQKSSLLAAFDGKDVVPDGPNVPPGLTIALMRIGPAAFRLIQKISGAVVYSARYTVSSDGKTMTEIGNSPGDPAQTTVWEKQ